MNFKFIKVTLVNGVLFAIPLGIVFVVFRKILINIESVVGPLADKLGMGQILGAFTISFFGVIIILLFCLVLGLMLRQATFLRSIGDSFEGFALRILPSLNVLKSMAHEKLDVDTEGAWQGVLIGDDDGNWTPGFLVEETEIWQTLYIPEPPKGDNGGEIRIVPKGSVQLKMIDVSAVRGIMRLYGQGAAKHLDQKNIK